ADAVGLRHRVQLGAADIGAPSQHLGRHADRYLRRNRGYRGRTREELPERARRLTEQRAERVLGLLQARLELRDRRPRALEQRARLRDVELRGRAVVE